MANEEQREEIEEISEEVFTITDSLKVCEDLSFFYCKQKYSDVTLSVDGQMIYAHKVILASRSEYFDSLFCKNKEQSEFILTDGSSKVFRKVLKYIYTGSITITKTGVESILDLLQLANTYVLKNLESALAKKISSCINMKNVCLILNQANFYDMNEMRNACHSFMDENASEVLGSDCLNNLTQESMIKLLERHTFPALEIDIFTSIAKWCKINDDVEGLVVNCIRLSLLSEHEMLMIVRPSKLVDDTTLLNAITKVTADKSRASQLMDKNLATPEHQARVISGTNTSFLLGDRIGTKEDIDKCASHLIGDRNGITVRLGVESYINHIHMKLWDDYERCYSYYIEVSLDGIKWQKVVDYSMYSCHSYQNLYFDQMVVQYIRVVGTQCTTSEDFVLVFLEMYFKTSILKVINGIVCSTENVATKDKGAILVEGDAAESIGTLIWHFIGQGSLIVQPTLSHFMYEAGVS